MHKKFLIKNTRKYGKGVFAARDILKKEVIHVFTGETVSVHDIVDRVNTGHENIDDPLQVGKKTYIDLDDISRSFNHSCNPNAALRKRSELFALRDILKGEEITFDYSLTIAPTEWQMRCSCNAVNCRRILGDVLSIPKTIRARYAKIGAMQYYMKRILQDIEQVGTYRMPSYEVESLKKLKSASNN